MPKSIQISIALRSPLLSVFIRAYIPTSVFAFNDSAIISFPLSGVTLEWFVLLWEMRHYMTHFTIQL